MKFSDKYANAVNPDNKKIELSNDAYAIGELLELLLIKLEQYRIQ